MKFKYYNIFFAAIFFAAFVVGCTKKLDQGPQQSVPLDAAIETPDDVESAMVGAYSVMGTGALYGTNLNMVPELLASEGYCSWRGTFQGQRQISLKTMTRDNAEASRIWIAAYQAINSANTVLENLDIITDPDQKSKLEGEALWVRAIMHFELVRLFALPYDADIANNTQMGVPIMTKATKSEADAFTYPARSTVEEVYDAVIADLTNAIAKLPETNSVRANKSVANAFLAKVYLQKGDFTNARDAANTAITADYQMNIDILASFTNKNTKESFFEIQQNDQNNAGTANDGLATFYASLPGIGRADVRMDETFVNSYAAGDTRGEKWYYIGTGARPGNQYCAKWTSFSQNIPVVRLAEILLIRAECNLRLGTAVGATPAEDLAEIRNPIRINLPSIAIPTLDDILTERQFELAFEGFRIHEFRRLKLQTGDFPWNADELVLPIPQREIDSNPSLIQNPGY